MIICSLSEYFDLLRRSEVTDEFYIKLDGIEYKELLPWDRGIKVLYRADLS